MNKSKIRNIAGVIEKLADFKIEDFAKKFFF